MAKNALLEIGTEEIPSSYIEPARAQMAQLADQLLKTHRLAFESITTYATPRRLTLLIAGLVEKSEDRVEEVTGPAAKVWKDAEGNYTMAAKGFAAKHNFPVEKLSVKQTEKGEYLCIVKKIPGEKAEKVLLSVFPEIINKLYFPKTMVWEPSGFRFARPMRSLLALYGEKQLKFKIADVKAGNWTIGLHTINTRKIVVHEPDRYLTVLRNNCVIADPAERREVLQKTVEAAAHRAKAQVLQDEGLVDEINYLVEHPVAILGKYDEKYLALPFEVLVTCLRKKQKFFAVTDENGKLTNHFIGLRNGISEHQEVVREGYERVLTARLADAEFFFHKDTGTPLAAKYEKLKGVVFQQKLGTVYDKIARVKALAAAINGMLGNPADAAQLERAAELSKADLVTDMVFEYPELQGVVGRIYAAHDGEPEQVSRSVEQHYWPLTAEGELPQETIATILSLADKLDTLVGDFAVGLIPSGSQDPYGLRRMAVGIIRMILEKKLRLPLRPLVEQSFALLPEKIRGNAATVDQVMDFFRQRVENLWTAGGSRFDEVRAVLATGFGDLNDAAERLAALTAIRSQQDFDPLAVAFKRASNILRQAEKNKIALPAAVSDEFLKEEAEKNLYAAIRQMEGEVQALIDARDYRGALQKMVGLKGAVDAFFDKVMVMAEDQNVRANRLGILSYMTKLFFRIVDFSQLQGA